MFNVNLNKTFHYYYVQVQTVIAYELPTYYVKYNIFYNIIYGN